MGNHYFPHFSAMITHLIAIPRLGNTPELKFLIIHLILNIYQVTSHKNQVGMSKQFWNENEKYQSYHIILILLFIQVF